MASLTPSQEQLLIQLRVLRTHLDMAQEGFDEAQLKCIQAGIPLRTITQHGGLSPSSLVRLSR